MRDRAGGSKLRSCDIVKLRIGDLTSGGRVRATMIRRKTGRPVRSSQAAGEFSRTQRRAIHDLGHIGSRDPKGSAVRTGLPLEHAQAVMPGGCTDVTAGAGKLVDGS